MYERLIHLMLAVGVLCFVLERAYGALPAPVAHWTFDGNGLDASGNGNDAKPYGTISYVPGVSGQAAQFHGNGDYLQVANNPAIGLRSTQEFSVTAHVQPVGLGQQVILTHGRTGMSWASWSLSIQDDMLYPTGPLHPESFVFNVRASAGTPTSAVAKAVAGQWAHVAATYDGATLKLYVDGVLQSSVAAPRPYDNGTDLYIGGDRGGINPSGTGSGWAWYAGLVDDIRIFDQALTVDEIAEVMQGPAQSELAEDPSPAQGAIDVPQDTTLRWTAGDSAATHDVYLGKNFADVDGASRSKPMGVLVSQGQTGTAYSPPAMLDFGQTYYWRVDKVNPAPDNAICKGKVWGFTVEPYSYPIPGASINAIDSGSRSGWGPEKTIDGSGMTGDLHGTDNETMWWSGVNESLAPWIEYQFDKDYKLDKLLVWNSNMPVELIIGYGAKDVTIEYSTDGTTWTTFTDVPRFVMATGKPNYAASTTVSFGGVVARYVALIIDSTWGDLDITGACLSEVRFFHVPMQARLPAPANHATDQSLDILLTWRPGREAVSHVVYFSTDADAVTNATAPARTVTDHVFDPGPLDYGTTYYWRVDEIGATGTYPGEVWSFTTQEFAVVDDQDSLDP